jgi:hypothetical protein
VASLLGVVPRVELSALRQAVSSLRGAHHLTPKTATALCVVAEMVRYHHDASTVTLTAPAASMLASQHDETAESLPCFINAMHGRSIARFMFAGMKTRNVLRRMAA